MTVSELYTSIYPIHNPELRDLLCRKTVRKSFRKGAILAFQGKKETELLVLSEGIARGYVLDKVGRDITVCFENEPGDIISSSRLLGSEDSVMNTEMVTDGEVYSIAFEDIYSLQPRYQDILLFQKQILSRELQKHWQARMMMYKVESSSKYQWFLEEYPGLIDKVGHKKIASFLGISPVTLSRIRHRKEEEPGTM